MSVDDDFLPTRQSLLSRLKDYEDQESWRVFFETYWRLIYNAAIKSDLTDAEAQDVVQETLASVMKSMPDFVYDTKKGSFKAWLLRLTSWRITDQVRKRQRQIVHRSRNEGCADETATIDRLPAPNEPELESLWDEEWERNLLKAAMDRVKKKVDPKHYQVFDLCVNKHWTVSRVTQTLRVNSAFVYLTRHRIKRLLKKEISYLRTKLA